MPEYAVQTAIAVVLFAAWGAWQGWRGRSRRVERAITADGQTGHGPDENGS